MVGFLKSLLKLFLRLYHRVQVIGLERVPTTGAFVLVGNHVSYLDPFYIGAVLERPIHFMAKQEAFRYGITRWFLTRMGAFPVNREQLEVQTMRVALCYLEQGQAVGIFPEGGIRGDNTFQELKQGASYLALKRNCPVVPVFIKGTERALPEGKLLLRPVKIRIKIGPLIYPPTTGTAKEKQQAMSHQIQKGLLLLKGEEPHGQAG